MITIDFAATTNTKFYPLYADTNRYLVLWGGGSSGKSRFAAQKIIARMLSEKGHRFLCLRKVARTLRESVFAELKTVISDWGVTVFFDIPIGINSDLHIKCRTNGNEILFSGLDDVEKLKSIVGITGLWIEEASELSLEDFRQLDIRLRGETSYYKQIILSFNPVSPVLWLKSDLVDSKSLDMTLVHSTYTDNRFLDAASAKVLESFKDIDPYYYTVYCLGEWGTLGKTIFDAQKVSERSAQLRNAKPLKEGMFEYIANNPIKWFNEIGGYIRIYEDVKPGYPYVIGGDTAGEGSNWFTGQVIDNTSGRQVATLRQQFDEDLYARQIYCLGRYYNNALIGLETNFSTYPVKELERLRYPLLYVREVEDTYTHKKQKVFGFKTTKLTRPIIIAGLVEIVRESPELINDLPTLGEMLTFVRNAKGRPEAQSGTMDDLIMGLAIAYYVRGQQSMSIPGARKKARSTPRVKISEHTGW
ncbi:MAG: hypothetical protein DDT19_02606 [Syntrophomonadaceae bacterium]|nr:hypothetical protein [Bacillota bacterium]